MLPKSQGFSVFIPTSRQEKGIDLAVIRKKPNGESRVATFQIKASRTYPQEPPKRATTKRYRFCTWFNRFEVPEEADFFLLFGMYAPDRAKTTQVNSGWYKDCTLLFTFQEMKDFMSKCRTVGGKPDSMFGFGFDDEKKIVQTRGDKYRQAKNFTCFLLSNRVSLLKKKLGT
jgi:hypothetical protein